MVSFVQISSPRDQSQESLHLHYPLMLLGSFSPNKQVFLPKKIGSTIGCRDVSWDLHLRRVLHFSGWPPLLLLWALVGSVGVVATLISEGPLCYINPAHGYSALLKACFISICSVLWMSLPDHLSPLASSSWDTCGFNILHRCDLGEGRHSCGLTHKSWGHWTQIGEVVLLNGQVRMRGSRRTSRQR